MNQGNCNTDYLCVWMDYYLCALNKAIQGPTGPKGDPGPRGPQGLQGPQGPPGQDTPCCDIQSSTDVGNETTNMVLFSGNDKPFDSPVGLLVYHEASTNSSHIDTTSNLFLHVGGNLITDSRVLLNKYANDFEAGKTKVFSLVESVGTPGTYDPLLTMVEIAGGSSSCETVVTYDELILLIQGDETPENPGGLLSPGCLYLISDYQSIGDIISIEYDGVSASRTTTGDQYTGEIEPLLVRAKSNYDLEEWGVLVDSAHRVSYDVFGGTKGSIQRRISDTLNIDLPLDWVNVSYVYTNTAAGGSYTNEPFKVFNSTNDYNTSNYTRGSNGIYIGRDFYGNSPIIIFGANSNALHHNVNVYNTGYFICNMARNVNEGQNNHLNVLEDLEGLSQFFALDSVSPTLNVGTSGYTLDNATAFASKSGQTTTLAASILVTKTASIGVEGTLVLEGIPQPPSGILCGRYTTSDLSMAQDFILDPIGTLTLATDAFASAAPGTQFGMYISLSYISGI